MKCPACPATRKVGNPLCKPCWFRLPKALSADLIRTLRAHEAYLSSDVMHRDYLGAKRVAVSWLKAHPDAAPRRRRAAVR